MNKYGIKFVIIILGYLCCSPVVAQDPRPDRPVFESVSVDPLTGLVTVNWSPGIPSPTSVPTDGFVVFWHREKPLSNFMIDTIWDPGARTYTFDPSLVVTSPPMPDPLKTTTSYTVASVNKPTKSTSLRADFDKNVQVTHQYDSCRAEIKLNWHPYIGWNISEEPRRPLISYHIMRIPNAGGPPEEVKILSDQDTSYTIPRINENEQYTYYIEAERSDGLRATSYRTEQFTTMPVVPSFINAEAMQYNGQELAEINFALDPASETYSYELLGSSKPDYAFVSLADFENITGSSLTLSDIQPRGKTYYYKLAAWHICKNKHSKESNVATALWLYLKQDDQLNTLQWDAYMNWGEPTLHQVYRQLGDDPAEIITTISGTEPMAYKDDLAGLPIKGDVCYWIVAMPESQSSAAQYAISNRICIKPESDIFIPQAFTPNGDGMNDEYLPFFSYPPQEYLMILYDRNGAKVFETQELGAGWDGHLKNGKRANEAVYGYYLKFRTAKGRLVEKRGTFTLVLP